MAILAGGYLIAATILYFLQERLIFRGVPLDRDHTFRFDHTFEEVFLDTPGGGNINALHFSLPESKGLIIYYHGNKGNLDRWGHIVSEFLPLGYEVAVMDYRGYGKSTGRRSQKLLLEDALKFYDRMATQKNEKDMVIYGRSLGTSMASYVASQRMAKTLILEAPFYSLGSLVQQRVPVYPAYPVLRYPLPTHKFLRLVEVPINIFHGTDDLVVPYKHGSKLSSGLGSDNIHLVTIEGAGHNDLMESGQYWDSLKAILN